MNASSKEYAVESRLNGMMADAKALEDFRRDNTARRSLIENVSDLEEVRDRLSVILDDVRGVS